MITVSDDEFESLVQGVMDSLPDRFKSAIANLAVFIDSDSPPGHTLGLYEGIPLTHRDFYSYTDVMPDKITLYKNTICSICHTNTELEKQVRTTVLHELGHYFGIDDNRLEELGWG